MLKKNFPTAIIRLASGDAALDGLLEPIPIVKSPHSILSGDFFVNLYNGREDSEEKKELFEIMSIQLGYPSTVDERFLPAVFNRWVKTSGTRTELTLHSCSHKKYIIDREAQLVIYFGTSSFFELCWLKNARSPEDDECINVAWYDPISDVPKLEPLYSDDDDSEDDSEDDTDYSTTSFVELISLQTATSLNEYKQVEWYDLNKDIPTLACFSTGVVGREDTMEHPFALENEILPILSGFKIPIMDSIKLKHFVITRQRYNELTESGMRLKDFKKILGLNWETPDQHVQGVVFMHKEWLGKPPTYINIPLVQLLQELLREFPETTMAGGVFPDLVSRGTPDMDVIATGFLILGESTKVRVQCTTLNGPRFTPSDLSKLVKLKDNMLKPQDKDDRHSSFALFFGSHERGTKLYDGVPAVEQDYFQALFPTTLLAGAFVPLQFCSDHIESNNSSVYLLVSYLHN